MTDRVLSPMMSDSILSAAIKRSMAHTLKSCNSLRYNNLMKSRQALVSVYEPFNRHY